MATCHSLTKIEGELSGDPWARVFNVYTQHVQTAAPHPAWTPVCSWIMQHHARRFSRVSGFFWLKWWKPGAMDTLAWTAENAASCPVGSCGCGRFSLVSHRTKLSTWRKYYVIWFFFFSFRSSRSPQRKRRHSTIPSCPQLFDPQSIPSLKPIRTIRLLRTWYSDDTQWSVCLFPAIKKYIFNFPSDLRVVIDPPILLFPGAVWIISKSYISDENFMTHTRKPSDKLGNTLIDFVQRVRWEDCDWFKEIQTSLVVDC